MAKLAKFLQSAAGNAGGEPGLDVSEVFSTYLYSGNSSTQTITNGIALGDGAADGVYYQSSTTSVTGNISPLSTITVTNTGGTSLDTSLAKFSTCYQFDGTADFLTLSQPVFDSATSFCFETWVRFNSVGSTNDMGMIANQYTGGEAGRMLFGSQNDQIVVRVNGGTTYLTTGSSSVFTGTWYHVAWTYDGTTHRLYLDGTLKDSDTTMPSIYTGTNTEIGGIDPARLSDYDLWGRLEDIRVTLGKARYTGSSYTVPTAKFPQDTIVDGKGGLVWIKARTTGFDHGLFDTERGATKFVRSNTQAAETTAATSLTSFNSDGFDLGSYILHNGSGYDFASWTFAKTPKLLDIVTYTGNGVLGRQISHDLGSTVGTLMIKNTSGGSNDWAVWHRGISDNEYLILNTNNAALTDTNVFNNTAPTSTHFTVGTRDTTNANGLPYVAYLFAHNDGDGEFGPTGDQDIIKCGSYTGNGSDQEIDLGFEPQWILTKPTTFSHDWYIWDTMRGFKTFSGADTNNLNLKPNENNAESDFDGIALTSTGFSLHGPSNAANNSGQTYIYIAIRRGTKVPESASEVFTARSHTGSGSTQEISLDHDADVILSKGTSSSNQKWLTTARLFGQNKWTDFGTDGDTPAVGWDKNKGYYANAGDDSFSGTYWGSSYIHYIFKRAPEVVDFVVYTGTGSNQTIKHNLGVAPDFILVSGKNDGASYHSSQGATKSFDVNATGVITSSTVWQNTAPTATEFYVGTAADVNSSTEPFGALLLANKEGLIDVGTYTGNGTSQTIDCGFSSGARFVMLREAGGASWFVFDTAHGIVAGDDDYFLGSTTAENPDGAADLIDPVSSGFIVNKDTGVTSNTNNNLATYIYVAIA